MAPKRHKATENLPYAEVKRLKAALSYKSGQEGIAELALAYKEADNKGKREILEKYAEQPDLKWSVQFCRRNAHSHVESSTVSRAWLTKKSIAKDEGLDMDKEEDLKELELLLASMEQRDHEVKSLAELGVKQYRRITEIDTTMEQHDETVEVVQSVAGHDTGKTAKPKKAPRKAVDMPADGTVAVDWSIALKKVNKDCKTIINQTNTLVANARKHQNELTDADKRYLRDALKLVESGVDGLEDCMIAAEPTEADHAKLCDLLQSMQSSTATFRAMLTDKLPKALPKVKKAPEAAKEEGETAAEK